MEEILKQRFHLSVDTPQNNFPSNFRASRRSAAASHWTVRSTRSIATEISSFRHGPASRDQRPDFLDTSLPRVESLSPRWCAVDG